MTAADERTPPTAEERAEWRKDAEMGRAYTWRVLRLLDALEDAERGRGARAPATTDLRALEDEIARRLFGRCGLTRLPRRGPSIVCVKCGRSAMADTHSVPPYTTSHNAMALVLAELERRGWLVTLKAVGGGDWYAVAIDGYFDPGGKQDHPEAEGETLPLCVARLALACADFATEAG